MLKKEYTITMAYEFHPERKGAKYKIGDKFKNFGEFCESVAKHERGLTYEVNPNTAWNTGSDIESEHASVKSGKASLARVHAETFEEILAIYFKGVASTKWIYMVQVDDTMIEYHMDRNEFEAFVRVFGRLGVESGKHEKKIKFLATTTKTIAWLEARIEGQKISLFSYLAASRKKIASGTRRPGADPATCTNLCGRGNVNLCNIFSQKGLTFSVGCGIIYMSRGRAVSPRCVVCQMHQKR